MTRYGARMLFLSLAACSTGWPPAELARVRADCQMAASAATPAETRVACICLYDRLPERLPHDEFQAWRAQSSRTTPGRDPEVTRIVAEVGAECAADTLHLK